jgi:hypothetical protein
MDSATILGKKESSHGYTTKLVCSNCNNTWMSELEQKAKNILVKEYNLIGVLTRINSATSQG